MNFNTFKIQEGKLGKPFTLSGKSRSDEMPEKYVNGETKSHWIYLLKYVDGSGFFEVEVNYYDIIIKVNKDV